MISPTLEELAIVVVISPLKVVITPPYFQDFKTLKGVVITIVLVWKLARGNIATTSIYASK
jgi:hypothetical protein